MDFQRNLQSLEIWQERQLPGSTPPRHILDGPDTFENAQPGSKHETKGSKNRKLSLPKLYLPQFRRQSQASIISSPAESKRESSSSPRSSPTNPSSPESGIVDHQIGLRQGPSERRRSSVVEFVLHAKEKVQNVIKSHRITIHKHEKGAKVEEHVDLELWTDKYDVDVPKHISRDKSELDYLRRTNLEATMEILTKIESGVIQGDNASILEVTTRIFIEHVPGTEATTRAEGTCVTFREPASGTMIGERSSHEIMVPPPLVPPLSRKPEFTPYKDYEVLADETNSVEPLTRSLSQKIRATLDGQLESERVFSTRESDATTLQ